MNGFFSDYDWTAVTVLAARRTQTTAGARCSAFGDTQIYQLGFKRNGRTDVVYDGAPLCFCGGTVLYLPRESRPDVPYHRTMAAAGRGAYVFFRAAQPLPPKPALFSLPNPVGAAQRFGHLVQSVARGDALAYSIAFYRILELLRDALPADSRTDAMRVRLEPAAQAIRATAHREFIDWAALAARVGMTPDYFRHCFRDAFGVSPQQLFLQEKLEQAQALLLQGRSVAETAAAVGMRDPKYFGRFFRSRMGVPPSAYARARRS